MLPSMLAAGTERFSQSVRGKARLWRRCGAYVVRAHFRKGSFFWTIEVHTRPAITYGYDIVTTSTQNPLALFYRSVNPMLVADDRRRYIAANDAACNLLRMTREELLSSGIEDVTPPENLAGMEEVWNSFLTAGSLVGTYEILTGDGRRVEVEYNATANVLPGRHLTIFVVHPEGHRERVEPAMDTIDPGSIPNLSPREIQVLEQLALGYRGTEIGEKLGISPDTVRVHVRNAMRKLGARTRAQAIGIAMGLGIISVEL